MLLKHFIHTHAGLAKQIPRNLKGKSKSSQEWLTRQLADPYVEKAKMMNLRCRSAFKLLEIDDRFKILRPGDTVLDCGAAPGSWTQVAVDRTNANGAKAGHKKGAVFSIDLLHFHAIPGATVFGGMDFTTPVAQQRLREALASRPVNCVLSDMAPNATGVKMLDQENIMGLCYAVLRFALAMSAPEAHLVVKLWANGDVPKLEKDLERFYEHVKRVKPESSRSDSAEFFLVARRFKGLEKTLDKR
ncbi:PREDICTED: rRNA methyltransferase 2, mitochondrial [Rhagoletis zephyria]|uniref:rRNA methyltransferase 2, mitochondrial n=1 Tax=Rhagoletis zephyria TaxID=28612 RepID=UPI0008119AA5|nr:PREDICTED: rRNA methyltransferase 2, mitochondrial [Rhagoletis zephyria]